VLKVIAAGGGDAVDSRPLDELLAVAIGPARPLLYLPIALGRPAGAYEPCLDWLRSVYSPLGVQAIKMWTSVAGRADADLALYGALYVGGGNTFTLQQALRNAGFLAPLRRFMERGGMIYGGSAGAIVLGRDIGTAAHLDENVLGLQDTAGLDLLHGYAVWCHYDPSDDRRIAPYNARTGHPVLALSERACVSCDESGLVARGYGCHRRLSRTRTRDVRSVGGGADDAVRQPERVSNLQLASFVVPLSTVSRAVFCEAELFPTVASCRHVRSPHLIRPGSRRRRRPLAHRAGGPPSCASKPAGAA
jgi:dipeptidase E